MVSGIRQWSPFCLPIIHRSSFIVLAAGFLLSIFLAACSQTPRTHDREFLALGTVVSISIIDADARRAENAIETARAEFTRLGRDWYAWADDGELVRLNASLAAGERFAASKELAALLVQSQRYFRLSAGTFDPAVAPLVERWGFQSQDRPSDQTVPSQAELKIWQASRPTLDDLRIDDGRVASTRRDLRIDLGAIGKGAAVDRAIELLRENGIQNALVNAGGNLRAIGRNLDRPWRVAIRHPRRSEPLAWLELAADESVATSGDYERFADSGDHRVHHLLDPRTGRPAVHTQAVTVVASDATLADAASTALFVAGPTDWRLHAARLGIDLVLRVDADGSVTATERMLARLRAVNADRIIEEKPVAPQDESNYHSGT